MEKQEIILEIHSEQRDEFHRQGDIRVDGPDTLKKGLPWRLRQVMQATAPAMAVRTGRGRTGEDRWGVPSMRGIAGIQGKGAENGRRKERGAAVSPNTATPRDEGYRTAGH